MGAYSGVIGHRSMTFDGVRNTAYQKAIREIVTPDAVVLDLGTGLGVLGFIAAQAGARKVYLVEPEPVIEVTRKVAEANGLRNVECIQATAETLELPGKVDLLLSVFTGNFLLTEDLLPSLFYARDHFLAPGGRMIPDRGRMIAAPVSAPAYYQENVENWSLAEAALHGVESYGVDYRAARPYVANSMFHDTADKIQARLLAAPACLMEMDFLTASEAACDSKVEVVACEDGDCHGWLGWFDMRLGAHWMSTGPDAEPTHWRQVYMPLEMPINVKAGQRIAFGLKRREYGEWTWTTGFEGKQQRQSTFMSEPLSPESLKKKSETYQPTLNAKGKVTKFVLANFDGKLSTNSLADEVMVHFGGEFSSREEAVRFIKSLASKFS